MKTIFACAAAVAVLLTASAASAQETPEIAWNLGVTSDYVFRGYSQTTEDPAIFGGVDLTVGSFSAGAWASNVDFGDSTSMEYDLYAGFKPTLGPVSLDVGLLRYGYTNQEDGADLDFWEGKLAGSVAAGKGTVGGAVYYTPENFGQTGQATYVELNGSMPIAEKLSVSGAVGHQALEGDGDYETWNLGLGYAINDIFGLDLRYWDTSVEESNDPAKLTSARVVIGLKAAF